jgi:hypothetical protein
MLGGDSRHVDLGPPSDTRARDFDRGPQQAAAGSLAPAVTLRMPQGVVPDEVYRGMFRIRLPGGGLSGMVNLTRARDALRTLNSGPSRGAL